MNDKHGDPGDESQLRMPERLAEDLKRLYAADVSVPPQVDRAIMDRANKHFVRRGRRLAVRWVGSAAAVAAVIILVFALNTSDERDTKQIAEKSEVNRTRSAADVGFEEAAVVADIDLDGRVDILDAFKLARYIKSAGRLEKNWDMNGDGTVNSEDVDLIALAAVRLDKGVL